MYTELRNDQTLLDVWALLHHSGAQSAEILGLKRENLFLDDKVPHFEIKPEGLRTVKARSRIRKVPLVGHALIVANRMAENTQPNEYLFPNYAETKMHDRFSGIVMTRLRNFTKDPKHTIYSLRHKMKDSLREVGAGMRIELALLGHSNEKASEAQYGSSVSLQEKHDALAKIVFDVPDFRMDDVK